MMSLINQISNGVMLVLCLWAVLDQRVRTGMLGTILFGLVGIAAFINICRPEQLLISEHAEVLLNAVQALLSIWFWLRWRHSHCKGSD
ncbi:hypothetical protein [Sapientia aquatica]|uniref:Uncharacterized protein n=1 Tax=Sapientia aquatica TaxID=1549640 RepID=A0A4R5W4S7_9BURK|nr:hypothetical protein [Sapientia aquatica]TDK68048.1 hypothetical protein E2I14_00370 [Sapientia aquatica]